MTFHRFALYWTPPEGPFSAFGADWFGWDIARGAAHAAPPFEEATRTPRKYGFHATIKPPFRLAPDTSLTALQTATEALCASLPPVTLDGLAITRIGRFLALTGQGDLSTLNATAAELVAGLDPFRAALSDVELAKRRRTRLTPDQDKLLQQWGYPYVMEAFRFHMTLTGNLPSEATPPIEAHLQTALAPFLGPCKIEDFTLCGEDAAGHFHQLSRHPLCGLTRPRNENGEP
ncbi:MAG TPA: phosphonate metabolism protein [Rhodobacteraceae bacterium]|jgi:hypothetical protein|nr:phosphonate metabolism protein [Paracoccaceae bacterium]